MSMPMPHNTTDLMLAPVALAIDARLRSFHGLDRAEIERRIAWETNRMPRSRQEAERAIVQDLSYLIPTHGWDLAWDDRGVRLRHGKRSVVLGAPANLVAYVERDRPVESGSKSLS